MPTILGTKGKREMNNSGKPGAPAWLLPTLTVAGAVVILMASIVVYVMVGYNRIYPEVYSDGVKLGGHTLDSANQLTLQHVEDKYSASELIVSAGDLSETFTPQNTSAQYSAGQTASDAYAVGRAGNLAERMGQLWNAYFGQVDVPLHPDVSIDMENVRQRVAQMAARLDKPVTEYSYEIRSDRIVIQNAFQGYRLAQGEVLEGVKRAFETLDFSQQTYSLTELPYSALDTDALKKEVYREPENAYLDTSNPTGAVLIPHVVGVDFDRTALENALQTDQPTITVPLILTQPAIDLKTLQEALFRDELSSYTTYLTASNRPRTANIKLAAGFINGTMLAPGDMFSYNTIVGQRTPARGFQEAGAYVNGRLVPEVGGGICQLSTTAYNAVLLADLSVAERSCHSMTVGYVPLGRDAMVNWGTQDLRFENNTDYPIQILAEQAENWVKVTIMGTKVNDNKVRIERTTLSSTPAEHIERVNNELPPGSSNVVQDPHDGHVVETYRIVEDGQGNLISKTFEATSRYRKVDKITEVGPPVPQPETPVTDPPSPPPTSEPSPPAETPSPSPSPEEPPTDPEIIDDYDWWGA